MRLLDAARYVNIRTGPPRTASRWVGERARQILAYATDGYF
jgi:hypothetical protein